MAYKAIDQFTCAISILDNIHSNSRLYPHLFCTLGQSYASAGDLRNAFDSMLASLKHGKEVGFLHPEKDEVFVLLRLFVYAKELKLKEAMKYANESIIAVEAAASFKLLDHTGH